MKHFIVLLFLLLFPIWISAETETLWEYPEPETIGFSIVPGTNSTDTLYLYNVGAKAYFTEGNDWGTRASIGASGLKVYCEQYIEDPEDPNWDGSTYLIWDYSLAKGEWRNLFIDSETVMYVDHGSQGLYCWHFQIQDNGSTFRIFAAEDSKYNHTNYPGAYVGVVEDLEGNMSPVISPLLNPDYIDVNREKAYHIDWAFVTKSAYERQQAMILAYEAAVALKAALDQADALGLNVSAEKAVYNNTNSTSEELNAATNSVKEKIGNSIHDYGFTWEDFISDTPNDVIHDIDDIYYILTNDTYTAKVIRGENEYSGDVVIPETVEFEGNFYDVTSIGNGAFFGCSNLSSINIPNSVTTIGERAFLGCTSLTDLYINCTTIGDWFYGKTSLRNVVLGNNVINIGKIAFTGCTGLKNIEIPSSVTTIGRSAFYYCIGLTSIEIPNSVTNIGNYSFYDCSGLKSIDVPNSVTSIGESSFEGCTGLMSVVIPNSVTSIGQFAFEGCNGLKKVIVPDIAAWCCISFGNHSSNPLSYAHHLYSDENTEITNLSIPNSVSNIVNGAFYGCSGLISVVIPNSVTSIGQFAFEGCEGLKKVIVPDIAAWCCISFSNYSSNPLSCAHHLYSDENTEITNLSIPNSVSNIGNGAFYGCSGLFSIRIPNSVTNIEEEAFSGCI